MRIIVADDSALLREGIAGLLERQGHEIVAQAADADELLAVVRHAADDGVDVVITDVRMPPTLTDDGLRAALAIRRAHPTIAILLVSQYVAPEYAHQLFGSDAGATPDGVGGLGYLLKDRVARVADFLRSLAVVAAGGVVVDPDVAARLMHRTPTRLAALTPRELEVLELMARGQSNGQIGEGLHLSPGAVSKHVANIFGKLDLGPGEENRRVRAVLTFLAVGE
ncbi:response regulator transcription factor [Propioniciclava coleopterorum]|uniref:Response regulator transcription factor n=1 Tax=Propioniciclava coleopterorum TaxID=2714937 RepID=A0A6G7Y345_9ACTN|nr:response regulator transcription factor [Propioniciclava coleopterorum]QIK71119.1 response regulator transcription factor [Propioniciclava coleopterorum]